MPRKRRLAVRKEGIALTLMIQSIHPRETEERGSTRPPSCQGAEAADKGTNTADKGTNTADKGTNTADKGTKILRIRVPILRIRVPILRISVPKYCG